MKNLAKVFLLAILALGLATPAQAHWWWAHPSIVLYGPVVYPPPISAYGPYYPNYVVVAATGRIEIEDRAPGEPDIPRRRAGRAHGRTEEVLGPDGKSFHCHQG